MTPAIPGYDIHSIIHRSRRTIIYRASQTKTGESVTLKLINSEFPNQEELARFSKEYQLAKQFTHKNINRVLDIIHWQNNCILVFRDTGGRCLFNWLQEKSFSVHEALSVSVQLTEALHSIHKKGIIHCDINPANMIWCEKTNHLELIDFGLATEANQSTQLDTSKAPILQGTLPYISPEQTGRTNRPVDVRSDLYSLGATLYHIFTGRTPFPLADPLKTIHYHLANKPEPAAAINSKVPPVVSDIILKLLEKDSTDRYQSTEGLLYDLNQCTQNQFENLTNFNLQYLNNEIELGAKDFNANLQLNDRVIGRHEEKQKLHDCFHWMQKGKMTVSVIRGESGLGKTHLIKDFIAEINNTNHLCLFGSFSRKENSLPYQGIADALADYFEQFLSHSPEAIEEWKDNFSKNMAEAAQILPNIIPKMSEFFANTEVDQNSNHLSQPHIHKLIIDLIRFVAEQHHKTIFVLEDLQYADPSSIKLIETLFNQNPISHFQLIVSYTPSQLNSKQQIQKALTQAVKIGIRVDFIELQPFNMEQTLEYIKHAFNEPKRNYEESPREQQLLEFANIVNHKTNGNPLFIQEFLNTLYLHRALALDVSTGLWTWKNHQVRSEIVTDNILKVSLSKINKLAQQTQSILNAAACIGETFGTEILSTILDLNIKQTAILLWPALQQGILLPTDNTTSLFISLCRFNSKQSAKSLLNDNALYHTKLRFSHQRLRDAIINNLSKPERVEFHLRIGKLLLNRRHKNGEEKDYEITYHLNRAQHFIVKPDERLYLAELNYKCGQKSLFAASYSTANQLFSTGIKFLDSNSWQHQRELTFNLNYQAAWSAFYCGDYKAMQHFIKEIIDNSRSIYAKACAYEIKIQYYTSRNELKTAIETGLEILEQLGAQFPAPPSSQHIATGLLKTQWDSLGQDHSSMMRLGKLENQEKQKMIDIMASISMTAYIAQPSLFPLLIFEGIHISQHFGHCPNSAVFYASYAQILCGMKNDFDRAQEFGKTAERLSKDPQSLSVRPRIIVLLNTFVFHWKLPLAETLPPLKEGIALGTTTGDYEYAGLSAYLHGLHSLWSGSELSQCMVLFHENTKHIQRTKQQTSLNLLQIWHQFIINLQQVKSHRRLSGDIYQDTERVFEHYQANDAAAIHNFYLASAILCFLLKDIDQAKYHIEIAAQTINDSMGSIHGWLFHFYSPLIHLRYLQEEANISKAEFRQKIKQCVTPSLKKLKKWARYCPDNFQAKYLLVKAELSALQDTTEASAVLFQQAIEAASLQRHLIDEALGNELAAMFFLRHKQQVYGSAHLLRSRYLYARWGAQAKVQLLDNLYKPLISNYVPNRYLLLPSVEGDYYHKVNTSNQSNHNNLDWLSIIKSTQAISKEHQLETLGPKLISIMAESLGSERGHLIFPHKDQFQVAFSVTIKNDDFQTFDDTSSISEAIIHYVINSGKELLISNVAKDGRFNDDKVLVENDIKSVFCIPLVEKKDIVAIVYLENRVYFNLYDISRVEYLKVLAAQAAVSVNKAKIYSDLIKSETRFRDLIENSLQGILIQRQGHPLFVNQSFVEIFGFNSAQEVLKLDTIAHLIAPYEKDRLNRYVINHETTSTVEHDRELEFDALKQNGSSIKVQILTRPIIWEGEPATQSSIFDITERKRIEDQIKHLANHDALTGLPNRNLFKDRLLQSLARVKRLGNNGAILFLDLDHFKEINDTLGHPVGDELLKQVSIRLSNHCKETDTVARFGGDEFAIIITDLDSSTQAEMVAKRIIKSLSKTYYVLGSELNTSVSIGLTLFPNDGLETEKLLRNADMAMYSSKIQGRNTYRFYQEEMNAKLQRRRMLGDELRSTLENSNLVLHYQPQIDAITGKIIGIEALIRWPRQGEWIPPDEFVPIAEQTGLIAPLGEWVITEVCKQINAWSETTDFDIPIAINLSTIQFQQQDLQRVIVRILNETKVDPSMLELEITEGSVMRNVDSAIATMNSINALGINFAIDDFGTGYSSLAYLKQFPVSKVKIDKSFVNQLETNRNDAAIAKAVINLGHSLEMKVVAEGVENQQQLDYLRNSGCDIIQGYYYSKPLIADQFKDFYLSNQAS